MGTDSREKGKISQLIFQGNVWRSFWRTRMWTLDLKGKVVFGLRQEMDSETLAKLSTQMFLRKPSIERLLQEMVQNGQRSDHRMFYDL